MEVGQQDFRIQGKRALPQGWRWVRLGDVCEFLDSQRIPVNDIERTRRISGKEQAELYPYYGANGQVGWIDDFLFNEPLILLAEDGGNFGAEDKPIAYAVSGHYWVNNHAHVLRPRNNIDFNYCLHAIRIRPDVGGLVAGSTRAKLNQEVAAKIPIPLPPLLEQRRIATILNEQMSAVEKARSATKAQLEAVKVLPTAYLRAIFNSTEAQEWPRRRIGEVCRLLPSKSISTDGDAEVLAITTACLSETGFQDSGVKRARMNAKDAAECRVSPGEVLVARSNTPELVGRVAMFEGEPKGAVASDLTIRLFPSDVVKPFFLTAYLSFLYLSGHWKERAGGASGSMKKITRHQIQEEQVPIPSLTDQIRVATISKDHIMSVVRLIEALREQLKIIGELPPILFRRAFSGNI